MEYLTDEVESWPTTPVNISTKPTGPEVDILAQLTLCPSQIVQLCDGHGWSALFILHLSLQPSACDQCGPSVAHELMSTGAGGVHMAWLLSLNKTLRILPHQQTSCPGTHCLGSLTICFILFHALLFHSSKHTCSPGFWLHVCTNLLTVL